MKNAGKACNNRLYRHIRTFEKIVKNYFVIWKNKEEKKFPIKMNFPPIACLYKTDASKKRGGRTWMKRIS